MPHTTHPEVSRLHGWGFEKPHQFAEWHRMSAGVEMISLLLILRSGFRPPILHFTPVAGAYYFPVMGTSREITLARYPGLGWWVKDQVAVDMKPDGYCDLSQDSPSLTPAARKPIRVYSQQMMAQRS